MIVLPNGHTLNRVQPRLDPRHFATYSVVAPLGGRWWRRVSCERARCAHFLNGWVTTVDERTERGQAQGAYIRRSSGRGFTECRTEAGLTEFRFTPGQTCFRSDTHMERDLDVPDIHLKRGGDHRVDPHAKTTRFSSADAWQDSCRTDLERIAKDRE